MTIAPHYQDDRLTLHHGDCLQVLRSDELGYDYRHGYAPPLIPDNSVDSVVTDPPYGLGFMGKDWDRPGSAARGSKTDDDLAVNPYSRSRAEYGGASYGGNQLAQMRLFQSWCEDWSAECLRVLKPGGHMLAFGGTRTFHRLTCAVEDAGFEIRDSIAWLYGSGFPKSLDVSKAITTKGGRPEDIRRAAMGDDYTPSGRGRVNYDNGGGSQMNGSTEPIPLSPDAERWQGWGTALKPAFEPIVVARKPLTGTVAGNVLTHGTGALNIDGCRVGVAVGDDALRVRKTGTTRADGWGWREDAEVGTPPAGRWPANVVLDESQAAELDQQSGATRSRIGTPRGADSGDGWGMTATGAEYDDAGGASRFFYTAKAATTERVRINGTAHPTVKPLALMRWLARLITPPGGTVLEPFTGSGTTVEACILEGLRCIAIEREGEYLPLIVQRVHRRLDPVSAVLAQGGDAGLFDLLDMGGTPS